MCQSLENDLKNHIVTIEERNYFKMGDTVEFFGPNHETITYLIEEMENENNEKIEIANHPGMIVKLKINYPLEKYDMMRIKVFDKQNFL